MDKQMLVLLKNKKLFCHICGLIILSESDFTADHYPTPKSKGGLSTLPSHRWCNLAQGSKGYCTSNNLRNLRTKWIRHGVEYNRELISQSIRALKAKDIQRS